MKLFTDDRKNDFFCYDDICELAKEVKDIDQLNKSIESTEFVSTWEVAIKTLIWPYPLWHYGNSYVAAALSLDSKLGKETGMLVGNILNKLMILLYAYGLIKAIFIPTLNPIIYLFLPLGVSFWYAFITKLANSRLLALIVKEQIVKERLENNKDETPVESENPATESQD